MRRHQRCFPLLLLPLFACGIGSSTVGPQDGAPSTDSEGGSASDAGPGSDGGATGLANCPALSSVCTAWNQASHCSVVADQVVWSEEACAGGCFAGACSATQCSDECDLAESSGTGDCQLWNMASGSFVAAAPASSLHDRARDYDAILHDQMLPAGGVGNARFAELSHQTLSSYSGIMDSAIWTGTALASEAWRLQATGSSDAAAKLEEHVRTLHSWLAVSGQPGYLARWAAPSNHGTAVSYDCEEERWHCNQDVQGQSWDWHGGISRDQYTGVMLGYYLAYRTSANPEVQRMIREDLVTIASELMKVRTDVPVRVVLDGFPLNLSMDMENVILSPKEMVDGRVFIDTSSSSPEDGSIQGMREIVPDMGDLLRQIPGLGFLPDVPRSGSAIMLAAIFKMAVEMSADDPDMATVHGELASYFDSHVDGWLDTAQLWTYLGECGDGYFGIHIAYIMAFVYADLEDDGARATRIREQVLHERMWDTVKDHKNSYLTYLWAATRSSEPSAILAEANAQLAQFEPGPRVHRGQDNRVAYPAVQDSCLDQDGVPIASESSYVDVGDRVLSDFLWQRHPWGRFANGNPFERFPGVDYLAAYWVARSQGFLEEDRAGFCARFPD